MDKVFVYGTLKKGGGLSSVFTKDNSMWMGSDILMFPGHMVDLGAYPGLIKTNQALEQVHGEVYKIHSDLLDTLDRIEGYPYLYVRLKRKTKRGFMCWVYVYNRSGTYPRVPNNKWRVDRAENAF